MRYALFVCPKCAYAITALATVRVAHRCPHPTTGRPYGPEREFTKTVEAPTTKPIPPATGLSRNGDHH